MSDHLNHMSAGVKHSMDVLSVGTMLGALVNYLPSIAAGFTIIWTVIRIYETNTVQGLVKRLWGDE